MEKIIETDRLYLRRFTIKDAGRVTYLCNDKDVIANLLMLPFPYKEVHAREWISYHNENFIKDKLYEYAVVLKSEDRIIGTVSLSNIKRNQHGELGYWFGKEYWGYGYASEAVKAIIEYAFNVKGYHKVFAEHFIENPRSGKVMKNAGMEFEGIRKDHILKDGVFHTVVMYAIINKEA